MLLKNRMNRPCDCDGASSHVRKEYACAAVNSASSAQKSVALSIDAQMESMSLLASMATHFFLP